MSLVRLLTTAAGSPRKRRDQRQLVAGLAHGRGNEIERMRADREGDRQVFAARHAGRVDALEIGRRGDVGAGLVAVAQAQPAASDVASSGRRIDGVVDGRAHVATAVVGVLRVERQLGQIDVLAGDLHRVHRRVAGRHLDDRLRIGQALEIFVVDFFFGGVERGDQALSAARGLGNDLDLLRPGLLEQDRLLGALDDRAEAGQRHRFVVDLDLAHVDQPVDEGRSRYFSMSILEETAFVVVIGPPRHARGFKRPGCWCDHTAFRPVGQAGRTSVAAAAARFSKARMVWKWCCR